jgi:hypothetical protein
MNKEEVKYKKEIKEKKRKSPVINYPLGDFLIRVKNAAIAKNHNLIVQNL